MAPEGRSVVAFENPFYDTSKSKENPISGGTGYEQVPGAMGEGESEGFYDEPTIRAAAAPTESPYNDYPTNQSPSTDEPKQEEAQFNAADAPGAFLSNNDFQEQDEVEQDGYLDVNAPDDVTGFGDDEEQTAEGFSGNHTEQSPEELLANAVQSYDN